MKKRVFVLFLSVLLVLVTCIPTMASSLSTEGKNVTSISPTGTPKDYDFSYSQEDVLGKDEKNNNIYGQIIEIQLKEEGKLYVDGIMTSENAMALKGEIYADKACTTKVSGDDFLLKFDPLSYVIGMDNINLKVGTYYLKLSTYSDVSTTSNFQNTGILNITVVNSTNRSLAPETFTMIAGNAKGTYVKVVAPKDGILAVLGSKNTYLKLYDSKKKAIPNGDGHLIDENLCINSFQVKAGTYYLWCKSSSEYYAIGYQFTADTTLTAGESFGFVPANSRQYYYVKVKPNMTGCITLTTELGFSGYVTLCNSSKKVLTRECLLSGGSKSYAKVGFAVNKNSTYYLRLRSPEYIFGINYSIQAVKEKSGSKVSKAVSFKKGKKVLGLVLPGESKKDYYAIKLTKAQSVKLMMSGTVSSGGITVKIYSDKKLKKQVASATLTKKGVSISKKLKKGTYYIVVQRKDSLSNGNYTINWAK